ncbi:hypothetical protein SAMN05216251_106243 [Actinacidiphila alni]|uniref:Uncharacterized protein n=1 Tax=Actinacidiphila alni TaxID=380248 RepID=A0A1I2EK78_9ACTN|nr:hypothetical protein SAMN05216251_106243 [Actinacidiphila alni]
MSLDGAGTDGVPVAERLFAHQARLFSAAYRMFGSVRDALTRTADTGGADAPQSLIREIFGRALSPYPNRPYGTGARPRRARQRVPASAPRRSGASWLG